MADKVDEPGPQVEKPAPSAAPKAAGATGGEMEIHRPKAAHSWREFFVEIGTIVIGILIALGLEQSIEALHENGLAREARAAIDAEMQENLDRVAYRLGQQACITRRLNEIEVLLTTWKGDEAFGPGLFVGDPGDVALVDQRWQANLNSGRFSRQPAEEQSRQAFFYTAVDVVGDMEKHEHYVWSQLRALGLGSEALSANSRPMLIHALEDARTDASDVENVGQQIVAKARQSGRSPKRFVDVAIPGSACRPMRPPAKADGRG